MARLVSLLLQGVMAGLHCQVLGRLLKLFWFTLYMSCFAVVLYITNVQHNVQLLGLCNACVFSIVIGVTPVQVLDSLFVDTSRCSLCLTILCVYAVSLYTVVTLLNLKHNHNNSILTMLGR